MEANRNRISELRRRQELLGDLLLVDHGISASPRLCASQFFINVQFYQWNSVIDKPVAANKSSSQDGFTQRQLQPLVSYAWKSFLSEKSAVRESVASPDKLPLLRLRPGGFRLPNLHSP